MNVQAPPAGVDLQPWRSVHALTDALNNGAEHPTFTLASIRQLLAFRCENGLAEFVRKIGNKVLVSEPGFNYWVERQGQRNTMGLMQ